MKAEVRSVDLPAESSVSRSGGILPPSTTIRQQQFAPLPQLNRSATRRPDRAIRHGRTASNGSGPQ